MEFKEEKLNFLIEPESIFKCNIHNIRTADIMEFLNHKFSIPHYEEGTSTCMYCRRKVEFTTEDELRQKNLDNAAPAVCIDCSLITDFRCNCRLVE